MGGVLLAGLLVVLGLGSIAAVVAAAVLGYGTLALAIGILSSAAFAARTVCVVPRRYRRSRSPSPVARTARRVMAARTSAADPTTRTVVFARVTAV